ncbi:MAG: hypothetical protein ACE5H2_10270 [Terriglobia bacterium]
MKYSAYLLALLLLLPAAALAQEGDERVQFGRNIVIAADETVGDVVCIFCSIRVRGTARGDAVAVGGSIAIDGRVGGDAVAVGGSVRLTPSAEVGHDAVAVGGRVDRDPQARVGGEVTTVGGLPMIGVGSLLLFGFLFCAAINLVLALLAYLIAGAPRVEVVANAVRERTGLVLLAGLGTLVAAVALFIISALLGPITPILAVVVSVALVVTLVVGYTGLSFWLGRSLARGVTPLVALLLGALLITILQLIPFLGLLVFLVFVLLALGSAALSGYGSATDWLPRQFATRPATPPTAPPP